MFGAFPWPGSGNGGNHQLAHFPRRFLHCGGAKGFLVPLGKCLAPCREIGAKAVELLVDLVQAEETTKPAEKNVILAPTLKIRGSTAPLKKGGVDGSAINRRAPPTTKSVSTHKPNRPISKGNSRRPFKS